MEHLHNSLEFQGGTSTNVTFDKDYSIDEIDKEIVPVVEKVTGDNNVQTQKVAGTNQVIIKTVTLDLDKREALNKAMVDNFGVDESKITAENISSTVSNEMRRDAVIAVVIATICMLLYIWFRFKDIRFATSAVLALLHDVLVVVGFYAIARISVGNTFIACMLTIVGYSINATIVIFDRIREEMRGKTKSSDVAAVVNKSITQTLTRSIYTSLTTFIMVAVLYVMGCKFYQGVCTSIDGRSCMRSLLICMYHRSAVVCNETLQEVILNTIEQPKSYFMARLFFS